MTIWTEALPPIGPRFPGGTVHADVAVIGGGLTGLSCALHLLDRWPGARVLLLEAQQLGIGASSRSTGMVSPGVGQSLVGLVRRLGKERARALYVATLAAIGDVRALVAREQIECELALTGQLVVARSADSRRRLQTLLTLMRELELPVEALADDALSLRLARPARGDGPVALRLPIAGTLHPGKLVAGLAARVRARGGSIFERSPVLGLVDGVPTRLVMSEGAVVAEHVVVATAAHTPGLGLLRGRILPVHLQALVTAPLTKDGLAALGWQGREGVVDARRVFNYFRLTADDRIVFGGGAPRYRWGGHTSDESPTRALTRLTAELAQTFPEAAGVRAAHAWSGVIGYAVDAIPTIARSHEHAGVVHAVGWCGHGVALAVASRAWVTQLVCDDTPAADLPWFRAKPPLVPFEAARWLGFRASVGAMRALDRLS